MTSPTPAFSSCENYDSPEIVNVGCGEDITIRELAELICEIVGFDGELDLRCEQARRHAAQAPRHLEDRVARLVADDLAPRRHRADLRVVLREWRSILERAARLAKQRPTRA